LILAPFFGVKLFANDAEPLSSDFKFSEIDIMAKEKSATRSPRYWVLVLANKNQSNSNYNAQVIFDAQVKRKAWGLNLKARNAYDIQPGDICLLYVGRPYCTFAGYAVVSTKPHAFSKHKRDKYLDKVYRRKPKAGVEFSKVVRFDVQVPVSLMVDELDFIKRKDNWGLSFLGSAMPADEMSFQKVLSVACMLNNKTLEKKLKPKVKSEITTTFNTEPQVQH